MTSKQQSPRQSQNSSPVPPQSTKRSLIFSNVSFDESISSDESNKKLLRDLKRNYLGVENTVRLYLQDNDGKLINAIRIDLKSENATIQFLDKSNICIDGKQYSIQSLTQSLIVSKVASSHTAEKLFQDLGHNYLGIRRISRFHDKDGKSVDDIRIDFKSDSFVTEILKNKYILIDGKRYPVQPYWSLIYNSDQNEKDRASENPQKSSPEQSQKSLTKQPQRPLTEQRVKELFKEQQMQLEAMINEFENKWNARLSSLTTSTTNANVDQLLSVFKDLTTVCQQFNQQNVQIQRQLGSAVNRVQDVQIKLTNEQAQQAWPPLPVQNGH